MQASLTIDSRTDGGHMSKTRRVKDLQKEFDIGVIINSELDDDLNLTYSIEYEKDGETKTVERQPYQIIYL